VLTWPVWVGAISEDAKAFHLAFGLDPSPLEPVTPMAILADIRVLLD